MKILLLGEYSNVHATLATALKLLGHQAVVVSDGDHWKDYDRDIDLSRKPESLLGTLSFGYRLLKALPLMRGYDVVQLINPIFFELKPEKLLYVYKYLRKYNRKVFLGAFGMDYYWVKTCLDCHTFRYSDFNIGHKVRHSIDNDAFIAEWLHGNKGKLNRFIAHDADGIIAGLYEYDACYRPLFPGKTQFIPFPIVCDEKPVTKELHHPTRFFIGIQRSRHAYKGTDIMLDALMQVAMKYPDRIEVTQAESVPFNQYTALLNRSDVILDQLYSYTPAMNALQAMAGGLVVVGGGEEENYQILQEPSLRPIINVQPSLESVRQALEHLVLHPEVVKQCSAESVAYIHKHHHYLKVAARYLDFWQSR